MNQTIKQYFNQILALKKIHIVLITVAFTLSVSMISAQRFFNTTLSNELAVTSSGLLTADLEIASTNPLDEQTISKVNEIIPSHNIASRQIYSTMIQYYGGYETKLIELVAVSNNYPLRGKCLVKTQSDTNQNISDVLADYPNGVIVSDTLITQTDITFGSTIEIGDFSGPVVGIIEEEPDINVQSLALGPRVYISLENSSKTGFDPKLSRMYHSRFYSFDSPIDIVSLGKTIESTLDLSSNDKTIQGSYGPSQPIVIRTYVDLTDSIIEGFEKLNEFYIFLSLFTLVLCGTGFAFIIWSSIIQQLENIGNLRFLGISVQSIRNYYLNLAFKVSGIVTILGIILGVIISQLVYTTVAKMSNFALTTIHINGLDIAYVIGFSVTIIVAITYLVVKLLNPAIEFHHFNVEQKQSTSLYTILGASSLMIGLLFIFLILNGLSYQSMGLIVGSFLGIFIVLTSLDAIIFPQFKYLYQTKLPLQFRLAMKCLSESHTMRRLSFISISVALLTILGIGHYELSLTKEFNPDTGTSNLPNIFFIDLYKKQVTEFDRIISNEYKLGMMVRTRIESINNIPTNEYAESLPNDYFLFREQNLTSRENLYPSEYLVKGTWFDSTNDIIECSVEERFARRLKLDIGDTISFSFFGIPLTITVTSIRHVEWGTFEPNFFLLVEPPALDLLPQSWVGSIYTNSDQETESVQIKLATNFPNITIINIKETSTKILNFLKTFLLSIKIGSLMCFFIGALLFVLLTKLYQDYRKDTFSMLYWTGMSKKNIHQITLLEQITFVVTTYTISWLISVAIIKLLFTLIIGIPLHINWFISGLTLLGLISLLIIKFSYDKR